MFTVTSYEERYLDEVLSDFRDADRDEVWAACSQTPREALEGSIDCSPYLGAFCWHGRPIAVYGVAVKPDIDFGIPWLLGTNSIKECKCNFLKASRKTVDDMLSHYPNLLNYVDARNGLSIKFLLFAGFTIDFDRPVKGASGLPFYKFWRQA
jgi:hypothetical protein